MTTVNNRATTLQSTSQSSAVDSVAQTSSSSTINQDTVAHANEVANTIAKELGLPAVNITGADLAVALAAIREKTQNTRMQTASEDIQNNREQTKAKAEERIKKRQEAAKKQEKAAVKKQEKNIWGWIAGAAMVVAGAALVATGVGAAVGAALIVGGVCALAAQAMTTDFNGDGKTGLSEMMKGLGDLYAFFNPNATEEDKKKFAAIAAAAIVVTLAVTAACTCPGPGLVTALTVVSSFGPMIVTPENLQAFGMEEKASEDWALGITIGLAVATLIVGFAAAGSAASSASKLAGSADEVVNVASKGAQVADKADDVARVADKADDVARAADKADDAVRVADKADDAVKVSDKAADATKVVQSSEKANKMRRVGQYSSAMAMGISGGAEVAQGALTIEAGYLERDAAELRAQVKEFLAWLVESQGQAEDEKERLQEIMEQLMADYTTVSDILKDTDRVDLKTVSV
ncbi:MAG: type III secretion system translocon subunit SctE [Planctomycetota bacterium]